MTDWYENKPHKKVEKKTFPTKHWILGKLKVQGGPTCAGLMPGTFASLPAALFTFTFTLTFTHGGIPIKLFSLSSSLNDAVFNSLFTISMLGGFSSFINTTGTAGRLSSVLIPIISLISRSTSDGRFEFFKT